MVAERILPPVNRLPDLEIRRVCDPVTRDAFCAIGSVCFHVPYSWFCEVFNSDAVWDEFAAYVGYAGGIPVSTAAIVMGSGVAGVYNVATLPGYQRQGYGEAVMRHAIEDSRRRHGVERDHPAIDARRAASLRTHGVPHDHHGGGLLDLKPARGDQAPRWRRYRGRTAGRPRSAAKRGGCAPALLRAAGWF